MHTFLWSGKDANGKQRSERVQAENAQAARAMLTAQGWTDLELIKDEIGDSAAVRVRVAEWVKEETDKEHTPEKEAAYYKGKKAPGLIAQTWDGIKSSFTTILICAALLAWGIYSHRTWPTVVGAVGLAFCILAVPVLHVVFSFSATTRSRFARLNSAKIWGRWEEVLEIVEELRKPDALTGLAIPEFERVRSRSAALAALGRLEEGLGEYMQLENSPKLEHWLYLSFLGGVYDAGRQYEKGLECRMQSAAENPEVSAVWSDVAYSLVRRLNRPAEARQALAKAESLEQTDIGKTQSFFLRGMILWREGKHAEAKQQLERAYAGFEARTNNPLREGILLLLKSYLCAVNGALGNTTEAKKLFEEVKPYLDAHREDELLQACRANLPIR